MVKGDTALFCFSKIIRKTNSVTLHQACQNIENAANP
jgi:hypothetical protein